MVILERPVERPDRYGSARSTDPHWVRDLWRPGAGLVIGDTWAADFDLLHRHSDNRRAQMSLPIRHADDGRQDRPSTRIWSERRTSASACVPNEEGSLM